jgi:hypothetical protein
VPWIFGLRDCLKTSTGLETAWLLFDLRYRVVLLDTAAHERWRLGVGCMVRKTKLERSLRSYHVDRYFLSRQLQQLSPSFLMHYRSSLKRISEAQKAEPCRFGLCCLKLRTGQDPGEDNFERQEAGVQKTNIMRRRVFLCRIDDNYYGTVGNHVDILLELDGSRACRPGQSGFMHFESPLGA